MTTYQYILSLYFKFSNRNLFWCLHLLMNHDFLFETFYSWENQQKIVIDNLFMDERVQEMNSELISNCEFTIVLEFINDFKINLILKIWNTKYNDNMDRYVFAYCRDLMFLFVYIFLTNRKIYLNTWRLGKIIKLRVV